MKIHIGADHAGFELKKSLVDFLLSQNHEVKDYGAHTYDVLDDYPDFILPVAKAVAANPHDWGIVIGGSGQGEAIAANRIQGVRAIAYYHHDVEIVRLARAHNDANVLSFGARFVDQESAIEAFTVFLQTDSSDDDKYGRRIKKVKNNSL